jgi:hypothetical protein
MLIGSSGYPDQVVGLIKDTGLPFKTDKAPIRLWEVKKQPVSLLFYPFQLPCQHHSLGAIGNAHF